MLGHMVSFMRTRQTFPQQHKISLEPLTLRCQSGDQNSRPENKPISLQVDDSGEKTAKEGKRKPLGKAPPPFVWASAS